MNTRPSLSNRRVLRTFVAALVAGLGPLFFSCASNPAAGLPDYLSAAEPLLNSISSAVPGLSQAQSILGAGSLLGLAKAKLPTSEFDQLGAAVPGVDALIGEATKKGLPSQLGGLADVTSFLGKSGISSSQVSQMIPALTGFLPEKYSALGNSLLSVLK